MITKFKRDLKHRILVILKNLKFLPEKTFVKILYECYTYKKLDLDNPVTFNEKIQWYKINYKNPLLTNLVDKYAVRSYVVEKVGEEYLNELYVVYTDPLDLDYDLLPDKFVIKGTHGCRTNLIVEDKSALDKKKTLKLMRKWMRLNYYNKGKEWAYKNIKPKIIVEKYLDEFGKSSISDYKFFCFDGEVKFIKIHYDRDSVHKSAYFDIDLNQLSFRDTTDEDSIANSIYIPRNFQEMKTVAAKLSANIPFVRVDLYSIEDKTIFGEMTFYPYNGLRDFVPDTFNTTVGDYFILTKKML